jgi:hypothetical protein
MPSEGALARVGGPPSAALRPQTVTKQGGGVAKGWPTGGQGLAKRTLPPLYGLRRSP